MNIYYNPPSYEKVQYYVWRAHEMRAEAWRKFFVGSFNAPSCIAIWAVDKARGAFEDKRIAP